MLLLVHLVRMIFVKVQGITNGLRCFAEVPRLPARTNPRHLEIHTAVVMATSILLPRLFLLIFGVLSTNVLGHFMNYGHYAPRAPGTLLLNMLIKDEAGHLDRVLPKWAKIIDYWIIGVDDQNTDDSPEIIMKHLSHIPGEIVIVNFDGMGPTWTKLVEHGIEHYPNATHGIVADADFMPMQDTLDKFQLDTRCSKHMYTIYTEDHQHNRKMDWIYRNIPGARVNRRVHQTVEVPELPNQEVFQTLIDLNIEERTGGYQDRSGNKMKRYIEWLEKDLVDWGEDDTRTLYYLGYSNFDIFLNNKDNPKPEHWDHLAKSVAWYQKRADLKDKGNFEERWFTLLKLGEIHERFYQDWNKAKSFYEECAEADPERADSFFYLAQGHRLRNEPELALPYIDKGANLEIPERSLFHWLFLYNCLTKLEYGRIAIALSNPSLVDMKKAKLAMLKANCFGGTDAERKELEVLLSMVGHKIDELKGGKTSRTAIIEKCVRFMELFQNSPLAKNLPKRLIYQLDSLIPEMKAASDLGESISCHQYRKATTPMLRLFNENKDELMKSVSSKPKLSDRLATIMSKMRRTCR